MPVSWHDEAHLIHRAGWLRAAVLGANDGLVSVASLVVGVAAAGTGKDEVLVAGIAGLVAGAMSMAAGEYVSVSSQSDVEAADLTREKRELRRNPDKELEELAAIYEDRGLDPDLARQVAVQLTEKDALTTHARDELGITDHSTARPIQAALVSALTFAAGAVVPVLVAFIAPQSYIAQAVAGSTAPALAALGGLGAWAGGACVLKGASRVAIWGLLAMAATALVGQMFGVAVS